MVQVNDFLAPVSSCRLNSARSNMALAPTPVVFVLLDDPMKTQQIPILGLHHMFLNPPASIVPKLTELHEPIRLSDLRNDFLLFMGMANSSVFPL